MENVAVTGAGVETVDASQARDPVRKDLLTELVQEGILRPDYEKELHRLNDAGKSSKPFEAFCQDYLDLVHDLYSEAIDVPDGDIQLEALTKKFGDLHLEYGETPNFPPVPPDDMTGYQQWNYCPESLANAPYFTKEDLKKHMRTSREAACLRAYNKMLPESAAEETKVHQRMVTTPSIIALIYALHAPTFQMMLPIEISCTMTTAKGFVASSMELDARHWMCLPFAINCMLLSSIDACTTNRFLSPYSLAKPSKSGTSLKKALVLIQHPGSLCSCFAFLMESCWSTLPS